jgi:hypothetical protein
VFRHRNHKHRHQSVERQDRDHCLAVEQREEDSDLAGSLLRLAGGSTIHQPSKPLLPMRLPWVQLLCRSLRADGCNQLSASTRSRVRWHANSEPRKSTFQYYVVPIVHLLKWTGLQHAERSACCLLSFAKDVSQKPRDSVILHVRSHFPSDVTTYPSKVASNSDAPLDDIFYFLCGL